MPATEDTRHKSLTKREGEFLELLAKGLTNKAIAERLFVVPKTVQITLTRIYTRLNLTSEGDLNPRVLATLWYWGITTKSIRNGNT